MHCFRLRNGRCGTTLRTWTKTQKAIKHGGKNGHIVNDSGRVLYDSLVAPQEPIIDYRTRISAWSETWRLGERYCHNFISAVHAHKYRHSAPSLASVQTDVLAILKDKILVGHSLKLDLKVKTSLHSA